MNVAEIGAVVRRRRKMLRVDQKKLSELAGVSVHTLSNIETGSGNPTIESLNKVLGVLGLELTIQTQTGNA